MRTSRPTIRNAAGSGGPASRAEVTAAAEITSGMAVSQTIQRSIFEGKVRAEGLDASMPF